MRIRGFGLILIAFLAATVQAGAEEPWLMLARGKAAYEERNLSLALDAVMEASLAQADYPEAEFWLGRIYQAQGQAALAEEQYRRALSLSRYLRVPDDRIVYEYALAELLAERGGARRAEAETVLTGIADEEGMSDSASVSAERSYIRILTESGPDELLYLYRDELTFSLQARSLLAEMAWEDGRYRSSLAHSTRTVLSMLSTASGSYKDGRPEWRFDIDPVADELNPDRDVRYPGGNDGIERLLDEVSGEDSYIGRWLISEGFWSQLYLLGASLFAEGYAENAEVVWELFVEEENAFGQHIPRAAGGLWGRLAVRQLEEPFISAGSLAP